MIATFIGANYRPEEKTINALAEEIAGEATELGIDLKSETLRKKLPRIFDELPGGTR